MTKFTFYFKAMSGSEYINSNVYAPEQVTIIHASNISEAKHKFYSNFSMGDIVTINEILED